MKFFKRKSAKQTPVHSKAASPAKKKTGEINYDNIITTITQQGNRIKSLLFAANSLNDLPVTIPVNIAVRLAKTHKCLLVDMDIKRNPVALVFGLEPPAANAVKPSSFPTPVENLYVWPAQNFELLRQTNLRGLLDNAVKKYDYVLIYAPYLMTLPDRKQVASWAKQAVAFGGKDGSQLMKLLEECNCKVIEEI